MPALQIILVLVGAAISFVATWRKLEDRGEMDAIPEQEKRMLGLQFRKGFDGKAHLVPLPFHLRVAISLAGSLMGAVAVAYFYTWLNRHGGWS